MIKRIFPVLLPVVSGLLMLLSCARQADYVSAIPGDASIVVSVDWGSLAQKSGLIGNAEAQRRLSGWLNHGPGSFLGVEAAPWMAAPFVSGLSVVDPMYFFLQSSTGRMGCVAKVSDSRRLEEAFSALAGEHLCSPLEESGVQDCRLAFFGENSVACFNESVFVALAKTKPADTTEVVPVLQGWLEADASAGLACDEGFRRMCFKKSDIAVYAAMPDWADSLRSFFPANMVRHAWPQKARAIGNLFFKKGSIHWEMESVMPDSMLAKQRQRAAFLRKHSSAYIERFPASSLCYGGLNLDGTALVEWLISDPFFIMKLSELDRRWGVDMKNVLASIDGDCVVGVPSLTADGVPAFVCFAEVNDSLPVKALHETFGAKVREEADGSWSVDAGRGMRFVYGLRNGVFFAAVDAEASEVWKKKTPSMDKEWRQAVEDSYIFMRVNAKGILEQPLVNLAMSMGGAEMALVRSALSLADDVECSLTDVNKVEVEVRMSAREVNALEQMVDFALQWEQE